LQLKDGTEDQQQIIEEAEQADATSVETIAANKDVERVGKEVARNDAGDPEKLLQQLESGDVTLSEQELKQAKLHEQRRLEQEWRHAADEDAKVRDLEDGVRAEREIEQGDFKQDVADETKGLVDEEKKSLQNDLREDVSSLESDGEAELEQTLSDSSELLDETVTDIKIETDTVEEELVQTDEEVATALEDAALL